MARMSKSSRIIFMALAFAAGLACQCGDNRPPRAAAPSLDTDWYAGSLEADRFEISTAAELAGLAALVNRGDSAVDFAGKTIVLTADIDLSERHGKTYNNEKGWIPIGKDSVNRFCGLFDGNRKTVSGLYINDAAQDNVGLFGVIGGGAKVANLGVVDAEVRGGDQVGVVAGWVDGGGPAPGGVVFCYASGTVGGRNRVGGIAGFIGGAGAVDRCYSAASVGGYCCIGGVVGHVGGVSSRVDSSYSTGAVGGDFSCVGGVVGELRGGTVSSCAALNPSVRLANAALPNSGRVVGKLGSDSVWLADNVASGTMVNIGGSSRWANGGADAKDGADAAADEVKRLSMKIDSLWNIDPSPINSQISK